MQFDTQAAWKNYVMIRNYTQQVKAHEMKSIDWKGDGNLI